MATIAERVPNYLCTYCTKLYIVHDRFVSVCLSFVAAYIFYICTIMHTDFDISPLSLYKGCTILKVSKSRYR